MGFIGGVVRFLVLLLAISYLVCFLTDYLFWPTYLTGFMSLFVAVMVRSNTHVNAVSNAKMTTKTDPVTWLLRLLLVLLLVPSYVIAQYLPRETILSLYFDIIAELLLPRIVTVYIFKNDRENELKRRTVAVTLWCCLVLLQFALLQAVSYLRGMWSRKRLENLIRDCIKEIAIQGRGQDIAVLDIHEGVNYWSWNPVTKSVESPYGVNPLYEEANRLAHSDSESVFLTRYRNLETRKEKIDGWKYCYRVFALRADETKGLTLLFCDYDFILVAEWVGQNRYQAIEHWVEALAPLLKQLMPVARKQWLEWLAAVAARKKALRNK